MPCLFRSTSSSSDDDENDDCNDDEDDNGDVDDDAFVALSRRTNHSSRIVSLNPRFRSLLFELLLLGLCEVLFFIVGRFLREGGNRRVVKTSFRLVEAGSLSLVLLRKGVVEFICVMAAADGFVWKYFL